MIEGCVQQSTPFRRKELADYLTKAEELSKITLKEPNSSRKPHAVTVAELFAGSMHLSDALAARGFNVMSYDLRFDENHDMSNKVKVGAMLRELLDNKVQYLHFAPPCNSFSMARWPKLRPE